MLSPRIRLAKKIRRRRLALGLSQREVARRLGCSQAYLYQVEQGLRPLSPPRAEALEGILGAARRAYTWEVKRGRPPLCEGARRVLRQLARARGGARKGAPEERVPRFPRSDRGRAGHNPLWPMALHLGERAGARVQELEKQRAGEERFWLGINSLPYDSWSEKDLTVQVGRESLTLTGVSPDRVGCTLHSVCGKTGKSRGDRAQPAFLLEHQGASLAWFPQRCVATERGHRWPDSIVVVARNERRRTLVVELDGPRYHRNTQAEERRDAELGLPVLHVHPDVLRTEGGLQRILDWACSKVA